MPANKQQKYWKNDQYLKIGKYAGHNLVAAKYTKLHGTKQANKFIGVAPAFLNAHHTFILKEVYMHDLGSVIGPLIVVLVVVFGIFLLVREVMCWYWKINEGISLLKSIDAKLANVGTTLMPEVSTEKTIPVTTTNEEPPEKMMEKYGIRREGLSGKYLYKGYSYVRLQDAIDYAKLCEKKGT